MQRTIGEQHSLLGGGWQVVATDAVEGGAEGGKSRLGQRQPGGHGVAAEAGDEAGVGCVHRHQHQIVLTGIIGAIGKPQT